VDLLRGSVRRQRIGYADPRIAGIVIRPRLHLGCFALRGQPRPAPRDVEARARRRRAPRFSIEHPISTAASRPGRSVDVDGRKIWPVDSYGVEGPRQTDWLTTGVVKQHCTLATYASLLLGRSFALSHIEEWGPTDEQIAAQPALADERQRLPFLIIAART
jgi:hypothetical protein